VTEASRGSTSSAIDQLILNTAGGMQRLTPSQLRRVLDHVAQAGFNPLASEQVRGRLAGQSWHGRVLTGRDRLPPAAVKYLWHVVTRQEWPHDTTFQAYIDSIRRVILDPTSGIFTNRYQGAHGLGIVRETRELRGPRGFGWVLVQYRLGWGHWTTAFQPELGLQELDEPEWSDIRWLRPPLRGNAP
jgi:hypothetical protein